MPRNGPLASVAYPKIGFRLFKMVVKCFCAFNVPIYLADDVWSVFYFAIFFVRPISRKSIRIYHPYTCFCVFCYFSYISFSPTVVVTLLFFFLSCLLFLLIFFLLFVCVQFFRCVLLVLCSKNLSIVWTFVRHNYDSTNAPSNLVFLPNKPFKILFTSSAILSRSSVSVFLFVIFLWFFRLGTVCVCWWNWNKTSRKIALSYVHFGWNLWSLHFYMCGVLQFVMAFLPNNTGFVHILCFVFFFSFRAFIRPLSNCSNEPNLFLISCALDSMHLL